MLPKKQNLPTNKTEFRDIGGAEGLLAAYQQGERDFAQVNLENADLRKANLVGISLKGANLKGANLEKVDFQSADLSQADLSNANLREAKLDAANLTGAILVQANLICAYMPCCKLIEANLRKAKLISAELTAANLQKCILDKAELGDVRLRKVQLQEASLIQAYIRKAKLQLANLTDANLQKADLSDAQLEGAILTRTDLRGAETDRAKDADLNLAILGELDTAIRQSLNAELQAREPSFAFSLDSKILAYLSFWYDKIILVDTETGKQIKEINMQSEPVVSVAFNPNGKYIYESIYINELKLWNPSTGELIQNIKSDSINFTAVVLDNNGKSIGVKGKGEPFELFDIGHETRTLKGYSTGILTQAHSPDGKLTAKSTPDLDLQIELLDKQTGKQICLLSGHRKPVQSLCFSPDSEILVSKCAKDFKIWQISTQKEIYEHSEGFRETYFRPVLNFISVEDNSHTVLVSSDFHAEFGYMYARTGKKTDAETWNHGNEDSYGLSSAFSRDGRIMARRCGEQPVQLWNLHTGEELGAINLDDKYYRLALSSTGNIFAAAYGDTITLWDVKNSKIIFTFTSDIKYIRQVVFSPNDKILASASSNDKIKLWNLETNCEIKTLQGFSSIECLDFSPQEPILAGGFYDGTIKFWDLETFEEIHSFIASKSEIKDLKFSPNGKFLVSSGYGSKSSAIRLWKLTRSSS
ncbi:WD-40 repeat-containing protein [Calothrix parasitica NIES-267]|uniref:WD-40 repeat-containing protein n=1 Tax=Calothrix parasitica NIES-267 TaxID=1973488 RepID=A0A1Z4LJ45_9CYAN|nr:WD-40 repeat-containing protein [Calothrix parasitica NIES-267]